MDRGTTAGESEERSSDPRQTSGTAQTHSTLTFYSSGLQLYSLLSLAQQEKDMVL